ncbi:hypothetical protein ACQ4PT_020580 [Festuca glaucescens]
MANFEVDPKPWLPWGHQVIYGGPTRLPRTFYFATQDPPQEHQSACIGIVDPVPPLHLQAFWRHRVRNFLVGPLNCNVVDYQPSLYGVGLHQFSGPTTVSSLVHHGHYKINNNTTVKFIHVDDAINHRAEQGFRKGWLMFVGMNPDYRKELDIANAVSTFCKFLYWNHTDPILERVLVYVAFSSPALVPRDVVFGRFASVGGIKDSWTVPMFILMAEFAEALPADEDPMPMDGNPHPMLAPPKKKMKSRAKLLVVQSEVNAGTSHNNQQQQNSSTGEAEVQRTPETPIHVLQQIGRQLGIPLSKLTKELLDAAPGPDDQARKDDD